MQDNPDDLEPVITERDSEPRPRQTESQLAHERRMADMKLHFLGPDRSIVTDAQIDEIVKRVTTDVVSAVLAAIREETRKNVHLDVADALKQVATASKMVLS
jgi:hypothetical protein